MYSSNDDDTPSHGASKKDEGSKQELTLATLCTLATLRLAFSLFLLLLFLVRKYESKRGPTQNPG